MTILSRVVKPGFDLTVCGTPSKAWLDWLRTTDAPLTADQIRWRDGNFGAPALDCEEREDG
ncbi:hypothetical protein [Amycolatopsis sp. NPDC004378]